jgi:hypothetical protein
MHLIFLARARPSAAAVGSDPFVDRIVSVLNLPEKLE